MGNCFRKSSDKESSKLDRAKTDGRPRIVPLLIFFPDSRSMNLNSGSLDVIRETSQQFEETIRSPV